MRARSAVASCLGVLPLMLSQLLLAPACTRDSGERDRGRPGDAAKEVSRGDTVGSDRSRTEGASLGDAAMDANRGDSSASDAARDDRAPASDAKCDSLFPVKDAAPADAGPKYDGPRSDLRDALTKADASTVRSPCLTTPCGPNAKLCGGQCVPLTDPGHNCASPGCASCKVYNATSICVAGHCAASCAQGFGDCSKDLNDGCETGPLSGG